MNQKVTLSLLVFVGSLYLLTCGDSSDKSSDQSSAPQPTQEVAALDSDLQAGKESYDMTCASCHGELGAGDGSAAQALNPKPRNFKAPASEWKNGPTIAGITKTLNEGIKGTPMVSYKHLGDETISQIAKYVMFLHNQ